MNVWKYLFPACFTLLDAGLTLAGQPAEYWRDHTAARELAPQFSILLQMHPLAFLAGVAVWTLGYLLLIRFTPSRLSVAVSLTFCLGHAYGATTWLLYRYQMNYFFLFVSFPLLAVIVMLIVRGEDRPTDAPETDAPCKS